MAGLIALPGLSLPGYAEMASMVLVGAFLQGVGGLGFAMFSAPIAALLFPTLLPGPLLALGLPLALMSGLREFEQIDWPIVNRAVVGRALGAVLGAALLVRLPARPMAVTFALLLLAGVALSTAGWQVKTTARNMTIAGAASGLMGTITSSGAPPLAIAMHGLTPPRLRATLGCIFFVGAALSLAMLAAVGRFSAPQLVLALLLLPWVVAGFAVSSPIARRTPVAALRPILLGLATLGAIGVLFKALI